MTINLKSIAGELGVSVSSVSRALSGKPGVAGDIRRRIKELANSRGFAPDARASGLKSGKKRGVTIATPLKLTEIAAYRNSLLFSICKKEFETIRVISLTESDDMMSAVQQALADRSRGLIISHISGKIDSAAIDIIRSHRLPAVSIDSQCEGIDSIEIDRANGTYQAARMLLLSGCRYPVFYTIAGIERPDSRLKGIIEAFKSLKKDLSELRLVKIDPANFHSGYETTMNLLNSQAVDGIFSYSDTLAIGALRYLYKSGIKVPEEVQIIGFDNIPVSENLPISLTTVAQPLEEIAVAAVHSIKNREKDYDWPVLIKSFSTNLLVRESAPIRINSLRKDIFRSIKHKVK